MLLAKSIGEEFVFRKMKKLISTFSPLCSHIKKRIGQRLKILCRLNILQCYNNFKA